MAMPAPMSGPPPPGPPGPGGPPFAPPGPVAPPAAPPMPPPMPPPTGGGASPQPNPYSDLSVSMPPHWQLIDVASRNIQAALQTGGFYQQASVYAALKDVHNTLIRLISADSAKKTPFTEETAERGAPGESDMANADNEPSPTPVDSTPEDSSS